MIYVVQPEPGGPVKIGYTWVGYVEDVQKRIRSLETGCPWPLKLLATIDGSTALESRLHQRFREYRVHREWFRVEGELAEWLREIAGDKVGPSMPVDTSNVLVFRQREEVPA